MADALHALPGNAVKNFDSVIQARSASEWARQANTGLTRLRFVLVFAFSAPSAASGHGLARDKAGVVGQKKLHDIGNLFWFADASHRRDRNQMFDQIGIG